MAVHKQKIACGKFLKPFGVTGELKFEAYMQDMYPPDAFTVGWIADQQGTPVREIYIGSARHLRGETWAVRPDGCNTPEEAGPFVNREFIVRRDLLPPLSEGEFLADDIIGCAVVTDDGKRIGTVRGIMQTGANDVWAVAAPDHAEHLIPAIKEVVRGIDIENKTITIHVMEGLLD